MRKLAKYQGLMLVTAVMCGVINAQSLTSINPNNAQQGQSLSVTITGQNTTFMQGSSTTIDSVWFTQGSSTINAGSFWANSSTSLSANFNIGGGASTGSWDVKVTDTIDGTLTLNNGFTVTSPLYNPSLVSIAPVNAAHEEWLEVTITGSETAFSQGSSTVTNVWFSRGSSTIIASSFTGIDATTLVAIFNIPGDAGVGKWDVHVSDSVDGEVEPLVEGFLVYAYPDLNGDGIVDGTDFAFFSGHWLEEEPAEPAGMVWVYIDNDPGVSGHEGFTGEMSKYETTNAQYCEYLNAANAEGLITVYNDDVYAVFDSSHSGKYLEIYPGSSSHSQITYSGGTFSVRSRDGHSMGNHPVVEVSWYGATAFCNYYGYRLPTEWEWQAVADYDGSYTYGCGTTIGFSKANYRDSVYANPLGLSSMPYTSPVDYYSSYGYGMNDMAGNVREWTSTFYNSSSRVIRGGSWRDNAINCTVSYRFSYSLYNTHNFIGFRVCR